MNRLQIRTKVKVLIEEYAGAGTGDLSEDELNHLIDLSCNKVASIFINKDDSYYTKVGTFSLQPNIELYDLPADCLYIKRVVDSIGEPFGRLYDLTRRIEFIDQAQLLVYYLQGNQIGFLDIPSAAASLPYLYIRTPIALVDDDSIPDMPVFLGHDLVVIETTILALQVDEEQSATLDSMAKDLRRQIDEIYYTRNKDYTYQVPGDQALNDLD